MYSTTQKTIGDSMGIWCGTGRELPAERRNKIMHFGVSGISRPPTDTVALGKGGGYDTIWIR